MKKLFWLTLLGLLMIPLTSNAQSRGPNKFYNKYKNKTNSLNVTLPGWLIDLGATVAVWSTDDPAEKEAIRLMKKVQRMKLLVVENGSQIKNNHITKLFDRLKKDQYEDLVQVRDKSARVNILIREEDDLIRNMFFLVREDDEAVMLSLKTKITMDQVSDMINLLEGEMDLDLH